MLLHDVPPRHGLGIAVVRCALAAARSALILLSFGVPYASSQIQRAFLSWLEENRGPLVLDITLGNRTDTVQEFYLRRDKSGDQRRANHL